MNASIQKTGARIGLFLVAALVAYAICVFALATIPENGRTLLTGIAIPLDLVVGLPVLFYFLIIRNKKLSSALVLPVIALGNVFVFQVAQPENPLVALIILALVLAAEATIAIRAFARLRRVHQSTKAQTDDPSCWFTALSYDLVPNRRAAKLLGAELSTIYYSLFSWKKKPLVPEGAQAFSYHKKSGYVAIIGVVLCLLPLETVLIHLLVSQWNAGFAWVFTVLSIYSAIWLLGECRASILRPLTVSADNITINSGVRFSACIPLSKIESFGTIDPGFAKAETVNMGVMGTPNIWITFSPGVETETFTGSLKTTRAIGLTLDDVGSFRETINELKAERD